MAWKKLAFTDEMLTNPMTANLDMDGNQLLNLTILGGQNSTSWIELHGGSSINDAEIRIFGKDTSGLEGIIKFDVPNAAKTGQLTAMTINGASDTPIVDIHHGLNMNQKDIENVTAIRPYDSIGIGVMMEDANGVDQVEFGIGNGSYAMVAYRPIDMNQKAFDGMVFGNLATAPHAASEVQGEAYYNTADDHIHVWVI